MSHRALVATGILLYLTLLLLTAPALLIDTALRQWSAGRIRLVDAEGTLWSGNAQIELRDADAGAIFHTRFRWQPEPFAWLSAQIAWRIDLAGEEQPLLVSAGWRSIELRDLNIGLPVAALPALAPALAGYGLGGLLRVHSERLVFGPDAGGSASIQWSDASTALAPVAPLGDYQLVLTAGAGELTLRLRTLEGPLHLEGDGSAKSGHGLKYDIVATLPPVELEQLVPFLQLVAVEAADGSFRLQRQ